MKYNARKLVASGVIILAALCSFGFILKPRPKNLEVDVTTRIEMIGNHQYAIAVSTTVFGYDAKSSIAMVHHEGCTTCAKNRSAPTRVYHHKPPVAAFYEGQM